MEKSRRLEDVVGLGKRIVDELQANDSADTLSRWMAHRIAELIDEASSARTRGQRDEAARHCETLILRLWECRSNWPTGWPPQSAVRVLDQLATQEDTIGGFPFVRSRADDPDARTWTDTFPLIGEIQRQELDLWQQAALLEVDVSELEEWLHPHADDLDEDERDALERLISAAQRIRELHSDPRSDESGQPTSEFLAKHKTLQKRRSEIIDRVTGVESLSANDQV